jgi:hypothetical protein
LSAAKYSADSEPYPRRGRHDGEDHGSHRESEEQQGERRLPSEEAFPEDHDERELHPHQDGQP